MFWWTEVWVALQVRRRSPDFAPKNVLDFGAGPSSALWCVDLIDSYYLEIYFTEL